MGMLPPGQKPAMPQPTPNSAEPASNGVSMFVLVGSAKLFARMGLPRAKTSRYPMVVTSKAPPMTKARLGSQWPAMSKKLRILAGLPMPEIRMPVPKSRPKMVAKMICIGQPTSTCRVMNTVRAVEAMKVRVAASERDDRRARPQMPWPLVQPEP